MANRKPKTISNLTDKQKLFGESGPEKSGQKITFSKVLCIFSDLLLAYCMIITTYSIHNYFRLLEIGYASPDLSFLAYILPAAFVFAGLTHTFYYNKERFANCIKIRFEYVKELLMFKLNAGLYEKSYLIQQVDGVIAQAEMEADSFISNDISNTEQIQNNIMV